MKTDLSSSSLPVTRTRCEMKMIWTAGIPTVQINFISRAEHCFFAGWNKHCNHICYHSYCKDVGISLISYCRIDQLIKQLATQVVLLCNNVVTEEIWKKMLPVLLSLYLHYVQTSFAHIGQGKDRMHLSPELQNPLAQDCHSWLSLHADHIFVLSQFTFSWLLQHIID